jgi:hypothetical protein
MKSLGSMEDLTVVVATVEVAAVVMVQKAEDTALPNFLN